MEKELNLQQNIQSAIIFLNTFNLSLEKQDNLTTLSKLKIYNNNKEVGELSFKNNKVVIKAKTNLGILEAEYDFIKASFYIDKEFDNMIFLDWKSTIDYTIKKDIRTTLKGDFILSCYLDSDLETKCICRSTLECEIDDKKVFSLNLNKNKKIFSLNIDYNDIKEIIEISPPSSQTNYVFHRLSKGKLNERKGYPYTKYFEIKENDDRKQDKLKTTCFIEEYKNRIVNIENIYNKKNKNSSKDLLFEIKEILTQINPDILDRIKELKTKFNLNNLSLIENLMNSSFYNQKQNDIHSLLEINPPHNLNDLYFKNNNENIFLTLINENKVLKK